MATWKRLKKFLDEMSKIDRHQNRGMPSPMFFNDKDVTGIHPNKSVMSKALKDSKNKNI